MTQTLKTILKLYTDFLTLEQVSFLLGGTERESLEWLRSDALCGRQLDGEWFVLREHLEAFILSCKFEPKVEHAAPCVEGLAGDTRP